MTNLDVCVTEVCVEFNEHPIADRDVILHSFHIGQGV